MRKSAIAAGAVLATGLMGLSNVAAFADSGSGLADDHGGEDTKSTTTQPDTTTQALTGEHGGGLIALNVPVAADAHEGVANNLNAQNVARDAVHVGHSNPAGKNGGDADAPQVQAVKDTSTNVQSGKAANRAKSASANAVATNANGTDSVANAQAVNVGDTVGNVVATATATAASAAPQVGGVVPVVYR